MPSGTWRRHHLDHCRYQQPARETTVENRVQTWQIDPPTIVPGMSEGRIQRGDGVNRRQRVHLYRPVGRHIAPNLLPEAPTLP
ncbi:hypothetical protein E2C01_030206 [Portunus trituberculatus]|uniref:Uncharacterized protein n=1 Tax=Portunus trituberculatus TaxID=210409 RepID=A0A5B7EU29_PORTR|nr:hypothetical protein [Portunus trituberculatus]